MVNFEMPVPILPAYITLHNTNYKPVMDLQPSRTKANGTYGTSVQGWLTINQHILI